MLIYHVEELYFLFFHNLQCGMGKKSIMESGVLGGAGCFYFFFPLLWVCGNYYLIHEGKRASKNEFQNLHLRLSLLMTLSLVLS